MQTADRSIHCENLDEDRSDGFADVVDGLLRKCARTATGQQGGGQFAHGELDPVERQLLTVIWFGRYWPMATEADRCVHAPDGGTQLLRSSVCITAAG